MFWGNILGYQGSYSLPGSALLSQEVHHDQKAKPDLHLGRLLFFLELGMESWGALPLRYIPSLLRQGLPRLLRLTLNLRSLCLSLPNCWGYRCIPPCPLVLFFFNSRPLHPL